MAEEEIWDKISSQWKKLKTKPMKEVLNFLSGRQGILLDLACGSGRHFVKREGATYGVDFSKEMLKYSKDNNQKLNIVLKKADISSLPFDDNFFDCAIFIAGLHCISSPEKREKALKELFRVMKPKAQALISVWSKNNQRIKNKPKEARIPWTIGKVKYYRYNYTFSKIELESLIKKCGFKLVNSWEDNNIFVIAEKP